MSQASPSKEPSMDEILASIRRIIESGDGQAAPALSLLPERDATTTNGGAAASASADTRSSAFTPSPAAARVVPLSERLSSSRPGAGAEARWLPVVEPANQPADSEPSEAANAAPAEVEAVSPVEDAAMSEPTEAKDRWTQELDDVVTWPVLDRDDAPADLEAKDAAEAVLRSTSGEPSAADFGSNAEASSGVSDEGDLPLDFDEADFVEALDRNTSFAQIGSETRDLKSFERLSSSAIVAGT